MGRKTPSETMAVTCTPSLSRYYFRNRAFTVNNPDDIPEVDWLMKPRRRRSCTTIVPKAVVNHINYDMDLIC